jgi:hypothetical protein
MPMASYSRMLGLTLLTMPTASYSSVCVGAHRQHRQMCLQQKWEFLMPVLGTWENQWHSPSAEAKPCSSLSSLESPPDSPSVVPLKPSHFLFNYLRHWTCYRLRPSIPFPPLALPDFGPQSELCVWCPSCTIALDQAPSTSGCPMYHSTPRSALCRAIP